MAGASKRVFEFEALGGPWGRLTHLDAQNGVGAPLSGLSGLLIDNFIVRDRTA
jgi:hypothetical protein